MDFYRLFFCEKINADLMNYINRMYYVSIGILPGNLVDVGFKFSWLVGTSESPAHITGCITDIRAQAAGSPFLIVRQSFYNQRHHCWTITWNIRYKSLRRYLTIAHIL